MKTILKYLLKLFRSDKQSNTPRSEGGKFVIEKEKVFFQREEEKVEFVLDDIFIICAYQVDNYTYDTVLVDILLKDKQIIRLVEEEKNFVDNVFLFVNTLPNTNKNWFFEVTKTAFEENFTLIYKDEDHEV